MEEALEHRVKPSQKQLLVFKCQLSMQQPREKNILTSAALQKICLFLIINPDPESWLYIQNEVIIMRRKKKCIIMFVFIKASFKHISNHSQKGVILTASRWDVLSYSQEVYRSASQYFNIC